MVLSTAAVWVLSVILVLIAFAYVLARSQFLRVQRALTRERLVHAAESALWRRRVEALEQQLQPLTIQTSGAFTFQATPSYALTPLPPDGPGPPLPAEEQQPATSWYRRLVDGDE